MDLTRARLTIIVPAAHTKTNVENRPLPKCRSKIILFVGVRDERVVGCHHGYVKVDKVLEERRLVVTRVARWEPLVSVALDVPVSVNIARVVLLDTSSLDLLKAPLGQVNIASTEVAAQVLMLET
jgi:hypothetical protein